MRTNRQPSDNPDRLLLPAVSLEVFDALTPGIGRLTAGVNINFLDEKAGINQKKLITRDILRLQRRFGEPAESILSIPAGVRDKAVRPAAAKAPVEEILRINDMFQERAKLLIDLADPAAYEIAGLGDTLVAVHRQAGNLALCTFTNQEEIPDETIADLVGQFATYITIDAKGNIADLAGCSEDKEIDVDPLQHTLAAEIESRPIRQVKGMPVGQNGGGLGGTLA